MTYEHVKALEKHIEEKLKILRVMYDNETDTEKKEKIRFWINEYYQSQYQLRHLCLNDSITAKD